MDISRQFSVVIVILAGLSVLLEITGFASSGWLSVHKSGTNNELSDHTADKLTAQENNGHSLQVPGSDNQTPNKPKPQRPGKPLRPMPRPRPNPNQPTPIDNGGVPIPEDDVSNSDPPAKPSPEEQNGTSSDASGKPNPSKPAPLRPGKPLRPMLRPRPNPNQPTPIDNGGVPIPEDDVSNSDPPAKPSPEEQNGTSSDASGKPNPSKPAPLRPGKPLRPMPRPRPNPNQPTPIDNGGVPIPEDDVSNSDPPAKPSPEEQSGPSPDASGKPNPSKPAPLRPGKPLRPMPRPRPNPNQPTPIDNGGVPIPEDDVSNSDQPAKPSPEEQSGPSPDASGKPNPNKPAPLRPGKPLRPMLRPRPNPNQPTPIDNGGVPIPEDDVSNSDQPAKPSPEEQSGPSPDASGKPNPNKPAPLRPGKPLRPMLRPRPNPNQPTPIDNGGVRIPEDGINTGSSDTPAKPSPEEQIGSSSQASGKPNPNMQNMQRPGMPARPRPKQNQATPMDNGGVPIPIHGMPSNDVPAKSSSQNKDDADFIKSKPNHPMHGRLIRSFSETLNRPAPLDDGVPVPGNDLNPNDVPVKPSPEEHTSLIQTRPAKPNLNPGSLTRPLNERPKPTLTGNGGVHIIKNNVSAAVKPTFDKQNGHARPHVNPKPEKLVRPFFEKPNQPTSIDNGGIQIPNDKEDRGHNSEGKMPVGPDPPKSEESQNLAIRPSAQPGIGARRATLRPNKEGRPTINPYLKSIIKDKITARKSGAATAANNKSDESSIAEGVDSGASSVESQVASSAHKETSWDLNMGLWVSRCCINTMAGSKDCIWLSLSDSFLLLQNELPGRTIANDVGGMATWNDLRVETVFGICSGVIGLVATVLTVKPLCLDGRKRVTTIIGICGLALSCILFLVPIARVVSIKSSVDGSHESLGDQTLDTQLPWAAAVSGLGACLALVTAGFLGFYTWADERNKWKKFDDSSAIVFKNGGQSSVGEKPLKEIHFSSEVTNETRAL